MCGICGKLNFDRQEQVDPDLLRRMMELLHHRGPDGGGAYRSGPVGLGHRRLSIIDLSTGDQPMCNEDGTVWVVYNGEIYNFPELRADLEKRGHKFKSTTDTEVIVHLYEELGEECIARLNGMFAFALWDDRRQFLLLARDRVGIKPLYYIKTGKSLLFASEIKSILADPSVERRVNFRAIDRFLTYYYLPGTETLFDGINKLGPGHYLTVCDGQITVRQYWDLCFNISPRWGNFDEAVETLQEMLQRIVKAHMISDVPVGVLLSGGVDSTGVLNYAVKQTDKPIHTFTIGFSGGKFADERPYAKLAATRYGTIHQAITISAEDFRDFLPKYVWHMEEPVCEPPAVALYFVSRLARESGVKVLLSGEGGDEAFGGYQNYRNFLLLERLKSIFGPAKKLLQYGLKIASLNGWKKIEKYSNLVQLPLTEYYLSRSATPYTQFNKMKEKLYKKEFASIIKENISDFPTKLLFENIVGLSPLNSMLYVDTKSWLPDDLLIKADKMTMATSVELRVPLLDHQILEFAASIPPRFKVRGLSTKRLLKAALSEKIPEEIIKRRKTGFPVPYEAWMKSELKEYVYDIVLSENSSIKYYFRKQTIKDLLEINQKTEGCSQEIFCLTILELLLKKFMSVNHCN